MITIITIAMMMISLMLYICVCFLWFFLFETNKHTLMMMEMTLRQRITVVLVQKRDILRRLTTSRARRVWLLPIPVPVHTVHDKGLVEIPPAEGSGTPPRHATLPEVFSPATVFFPRM